MNAHKHGMRIAAALLLLHAPSASAQDAIARVGWIAGCWEARSPTRSIDEIWMKPAGGMMLGMARTVVRDSVRETESTIIRQRGSMLEYEARPSGQATAVFPAIHVSADSVVFELKEHDFPNRIGYMRRGADSLVAWIEGTRGGQVRRIPYAYRRGTCP
jgi:hypothetical protein